MINNRFMTLLFRVIYTLTLWNRINLQRRRVCGRMHGFGRLRIPRKKLRYHMPCSSGCCTVVFVKVLAWGGKEA